MRMEEGSEKEMQHEKDLTRRGWLLEDGGWKPQTKECGQLPDAENKFPAKSQQGNEDPWSYNHRELNSANNSK